MCVHEQSSFAKSVSWQETGVCVPHDSFACETRLVHSAHKGMSLTRVCDVTRLFLQRVIMQFWNYQRKRKKNTLLCFIKKDVHES